MPRPSLGPRLYLRKGRVDTKSGKPIPDMWFIRDGARQVGTGCGVDRLQGPGGAQEQLGLYLIAQSAREGGDTASRSDPAQVLVSDVIHLYLRERAPELKADPKSTAGFAAHLIVWWGARTLADVKRSTCREYVTHRTSQTNSRYGPGAAAPKISDQTARRELETLSAAIGYWHGEDPLKTRPVVWLPEKPESPRDSLTRGQAAALLRAARGSRWNATAKRWEGLGRPKPDAEGETRRGRSSAATNRAHLRRFILIGLYTGTRHAVIRKLLWTESPTQAWVDLERGMIYRRGRAERDTATKRRPVVKIPARLLAHMRRWQQLDLAEAARRGKPVTAVVHHGGRPIAGKIRTGWQGCVRDAGLPAEITPHWMRHTCATWLMESDIEMWDAAAYTGMTVKTLEQHYAHHRPSYLADAAGAASRGGRRKPLA